ncbi:disease resistance protein RPV1-like [Syzygium oleosum]|uniref:disease resistance protein RPV1-like n=1 Tax=Syzygium oleosum TaxID=219896 RepID=UPI0024B8B63F|nr:disease resistance protein RPV1-like [Syzygium oleosum]
MDISHATNHSSSMSRRPLYEVFLSFRGPDARRDFVDCLCTSLTDAGIGVFKDEEELKIGEGITPQLIQAIKQSKISIPVISKGYGYSKSCLMELEQMLKSMDNESHLIIPIFYYVNPSDVRNCRGPFARSMQGHKRNYEGSVINSWVSSLRQIGQLTGYHLHETSEMPHGKLIKQIVHQVLHKLKKEDLIVTKHLVGVDPHVQDIMAKLKVDYRNGQAVNIGPTREKVLIHGIAGVGKTALAKHVYNQIYHLFDACSFLGQIRAEIKRHRVLSLQNKLISDLHKGNVQKFYCSDNALTHIQNRFLTMKILVLLDDVKDHEQLGAIVGELDWLGPGSRVILTSQTKDVLRNINGAESFGLGLMGQHEALRLFCRHAFGKDSPPEKFENLSKDIVAATDGLPLALTVVGSSLFLVKSKKAWQETLTALEAAPDKRVQAALEKSYINLDENERQIFLDIACFFIGKDKRIPSYMWDDYGYYPSLSIRALHARSLVEIGEDKELCMHEILKNFGRELVKSENRNEPCKRSRLCDHKDALHVLNKSEGTKKVEALGLEFGEGSEGNFCFGCDQFDGLQKLRFLKLDQANIRGNFGDRLLSLRWLDWRGCPKTFGDLNLNLKDLVILDLSWSQVDGDWRGWELLDQVRTEFTIFIHFFCGGRIYQEQNIYYHNLFVLQTKKLKVLKLTGCVQLTTTPKFPASMELERLILEGCSQLAAIHPSFGNLKELVSLNMKGCSLVGGSLDLGPMRGLKELLIDGTSIRRINFKEGSIRKLKILSARGCKHLNEIPNSIRYLKSLTFLALDGSEISTLRESIEELEKLKTLSLKNCGRLSYLPDGIGKLSSLQSLDLSHTGIQKLPPSVKDLKAMKVLRMKETFIHEFPEAILNLEKLEEIDLSSCQRLEGRINYDIGTLSSLAILKLSDTPISGLPPSILRLSHLRELHILGCNNLQSLPKLLESVIVFK